jgi:filamentous hemagglutinin
VNGELRQASEGVDTPDSRPDRERTPESNMDALLKTNPDVVDRLIDRLYGGADTTSEPRNVVVDDARRGQLESIVEQRAITLQDGLPEACKGRVTMAVGVGHDSSNELRTVVGTSEPNGYLRPSVRSALQGGEEVAAGLSHAERDIVGYMRYNDIRPITVGAGRPICPACADAINDAGATPATPLKRT